jgi:Zn-finger nucleic acid-binding protein
MRQDKTYCPHCGVSLQGSLIPEEHQHWYNHPDAKPGDPDWVTHGGRAIGVEVLGVYDGVLYWQCPDCDGMWNRWPNTEYFKRLHDQAEWEMMRAW